MWRATRARQRNQTKAPKRRKATGAAYSEKTYVTNGGGENRRHGVSVKRNSAAEKAASAKIESINGINNGAEISGGS